MVTSLLFPLLLPFLWEGPFWILAAAAAVWGLTHWDEPQTRPQSRYRHLWAGMASLGMVGLIYLITSEPSVAALTTKLGEREVGIQGTALLLYVVATCVAVWRRRQIGWFLLALLVLGWAPTQSLSAQVLRGRSFYGTHRLVSATASDGSTWAESYFHGDTEHNRTVFESEPGPQIRTRLRHSLYYGPEEPIATLMHNLQPHPETGRRIGIAGLGAGGLACFIEPGDEWTFYEIDELVVSWAVEQMSTLAHCTPTPPTIILGDARQSLRHHNPETAGRFDMLVLDAFTSLAIPTHLVTQEALALYRTRLTPEGVLVFNITNRFVCLEAVLAQTAALENLYSYVQSGPTSLWMLITPTAAQGPQLLPESRPAVATGPAWTDGYRPLLPALCAWQQLVQSR